MPNDIDMCVFVCAWVPVCVFVCVCEREGEGEGNVEVDCLLVLGNLVQVDEAYLGEESVKLPVQVNGKVRGVIEVALDADEESILAMAKEEQNVARYLEGKTIKKKIYKAGKILNFIVG